MVYTALFLTVAVGVITQNSDTLMAKFRGETNVQAVDDIFTVYAGREQRLYVLRNDIGSQNLDVSTIRLLDQPSCGSVAKTGGSFLYSSSASCSGHQTFSYCLSSGANCKAASVALRVVEARDPVDSVANGPIVELSGFETQLGYNAQELEITNVRLGKVAASETTPVSTSSAKLARIAVEETVAITRPQPVERMGKVDGTFMLGEMPQIDADTLVEVAATTGSVTDAALTDETAELLLPILPNTGNPPALEGGNWQSLTARMVEIDMGFRTPTVMAGIDQSPFGTPCSADLSSKTIAGGMVELNLSAACLPNARVEIRHGKLKVTMRADHTGKLRIEIPAFEENARFQIILADGTRLNTAARVPDLANINRVAILWKGDFQANLLAMEFGANTANTGDGFLIRLGDSSFAKANMAEVYSLPVSSSTKSGVIDFEVTARPLGASCDQNRIIQSLRSRGGRLVGASGVEFKLPACGNSPQSIVLKNVVRDLIIATK
ncbi:MAG: hypothetical protein GXP03_13790 [Alphaproteobacteria bacterium]|nr:hypothetical protein [Alphaproteobacteria bacterium]